MVRPLAGSKPPSKDGRGLAAPGRGPHDDIEVRVAYILNHAPALTSWVSDVVLKEFRVSVLKDGYRVMVKGKRRKEHVVAFFNADTWSQVLATATTSLDTHYAVWHRDMYPPK